MFHTKKILDWYQKNKRDLPWRKTKEPYSIWISEIILQQTRIAQGLNYYLRFIAAFPNIQILANSNEEEVLKLWQGLGYYSRARNLHFTAKHIVRDLNGIFPDTYNDLLKLKGIGKYTAAAIASIAYKEPVAVVDGNVIRVISRLFAYNESVATSKGLKDIYQFADNLIDKKNPGDFNQAMMELGALICCPQNPQCSVCPVKNKCIAFINREVQNYPVAKIKTVSKNRYLNYFILVHKSKVFIKKRKEQDIWNNLYDFPHIETENPIELQELQQTSSWKNLFGKIKLKETFPTEKKIHKLSHQNLHLIFYKMEILKFDKLIETNFMKIPITDIEKYPVPKPVENYISKNLK